MTWKICAAAMALALAACADETATDDIANRAEPAPPPQEDGNRAKGEDSLAWNFSTSVRGPKLAYGEPRTDNVRLMLRCAGGGRIELSFMRGEAGGERMTVTSGGASETVPGRAEDSQLGGYFVRAELPADAAPLQRFRAGSSLTVEWEDDTRNVPPAGPEADRLLEAC